MTDKPEPPQWVVGLCLSYIKEIDEGIPEGTIDHSFSNLQKETVISTLRNLYFDGHLTRADGWRPIDENTPKNKAVICYGVTAGEISGIHDEKVVRTAILKEPISTTDYEGFEWVVIGGDYYMTWMKPTHWRPLLEPPTEKEKLLNG